MNVQETIDQLEVYLEDYSDSSWTEAHVAQRFINYHRTSLLWSNELDWLKWDGKRWVPSSSHAAFNIMRKWIMSRYTEAMRMAALGIDLNALADTTADVVTYDYASRCNGIMSEWQTYLSTAKHVRCVEASPSALAFRRAAEFDAILICLMCRMVC